ncbi:MAG TPA: hypothetical protein VMV18_02175 [bacterium]|nr:hypothetical protein [bacterium]
MRANAMVAMLFLAAVVAGILIAMPRRAAAVDPTCDHVLCHCPDGPVMAPCTADCSDVCSGRSSGTSGERPERTPRPPRQPSTNEVAFPAELSARDLEVIGSTARCRQAMEMVWQDADGFAAEANDLSMGFVEDEYQKTLKKVAKRAEGKSNYKKAYDSLKDWKDTVKQWSSQFDELEACIENPQCSLQDLLKKTNKDIRKWLEKGPGGMGEAAARVNKAAGLLDAYASDLEQAAEQHMSEAAACR